MLARVKLKNCKTIKKLDVVLKKINCLVGKNGVGKTTLIKSIQYFYASLEGKKSVFTINDQNNPYNEYSEIEMFYDFTYFSKVYEGYRLKNLSGEIKNSSFMSNIGELCSLCDHNNILKVKLLINKKEEKKWIPNLSYELRGVLKTIYPFYFISSNSYEHTDWKELWDMIAELAKLPNFNINDEIGNLLEENYNSSFSKIIETIKKELSDSNIIVNRFSNQEKFLNTIKLQLGGEKLQFKYRDLNFYSDGTNSFNYLKLFCSLLNKLAKQKLKIPMVFLDEPEVGLHPKYIDDLMVNLFTENNKNQVFLVTHSSRILKNVIKMTNEYNILHANHQSDYSKITVVNQFLDHRERNVLTDEEASYYFSNKIVFVEGNTELELFNNHHLLNLYPHLRDVDFYSFDADTVNLSTIHPEVRNIRIPFLILIDSDYVFDVNDIGYIKIKKGRGSKDFLNPLDDERFETQHNKELFHFGEKSKLYTLRKKINRIISTYKFSYNQYWFTIYGKYFIEFQNLVKSYCLNYNVYPVSTTTEGTLVNINNVELFKEWLKKNHIYSKKYLDDLFNISNLVSVKASAFRLIVEGKYDTLQKIKEVNITNTYPENIKNGYILVRKLRKEYEKTSGWVSEWINYFFESVITDDMTVDEKEIIFNLYFPELTDIINRVKNM